MVASINCKFERDEIRDLLPAFIENFLIGFLGFGASFCSVSTPFATSVVFPADLFEGSCRFLSIKTEAERLGAGVLDVEAAVGGSAVAAWGTPSTRVVSLSDRLDSRGAHISTLESLATMGDSTKGVRPS